MLSFCASWNSSTNLSAALQLPLMLLRICKVQLKRQWGIFYNRICVQNPGGLLEALQIMAH